MEQTQIQKVAILVFTNWETLNHKKRDGFKESGQYVFWYGSKVPKKIIELLPDGSNFDRQGYSIDNLTGGILEDNANDLTGFDVRIYFQVEKKIRGYFKVSSIKFGKGENELRFWSDDWVEEEREGKKGHQGWEYYNGGEGNSSTG